LHHHLARFRRRSSWSSRIGHRNGLRSEEHLGVYGERYFGVPSKVLLLCKPQRSLHALGLHRHAETSSAASCLDRNPHHPSAPRCAQTAAPLLANVLVTFCILDPFVTKSQRNVNSWIQDSLSPTTFGQLFSMCTFLLFTRDLLTTVTSFFLLRVAVRRPYAGVGGSLCRTGARRSRGTRWSDPGRSP
jgi:hypothetical protein